MAGDCQNQMLFMKNAAVKNIRIQGSVVKNQVYRTLLQKLSQLSRTFFNQIYLYMGITRYKGRNQDRKSVVGKIQEEKRLLPPRVRFPVDSLSQSCIKAEKLL